MIDESYNTVPERIVEFRAKHPDSTLQTVILFKPEEVGGWVVEARAYRTPDDQRPGIGLAFEPVPGKTNFTRDSELQNCETSAWGRAIIAVGAADAKKGIASAEDIRNRAPAPLAGSETDAALSRVGSSPTTSVAGDTPVGTEVSAAPAGSASEEVEPGTSTGDAGSASSVEPSHQHGDWTPAPRDGWMLCTRLKNGKPCQHAEKAERVNA